MKSKHKPGIPVDRKNQCWNCHEPIQDVLLRTRNHESAVFCCKQCKARFQARDRWNFRDKFCEAFL